MSTDKGLTVEPDNRLEFEATPAKEEVMPAEDYSKDSTPMLSEKAEDEDELNPLQEEIKKLVKEKVSSSS